MDEEVEEQLAKFFDQAAKVFPDLTANAAPLNYGTFGVTLEYPDSTVRKILFYHSEHPQTQKMAEDGFKREVDTLKILSSSAAAGFVPELLEEPEHYDPDTGFMGSYLMTRMNGTTPTWREDKIARTLQRYDFKRMAQSAGALLGRFHNATENTGEIKPPSKGLERHYGHKIPRLPTLSDEENDQLMRVNDYLAGHLIEGTVHGDLHGNNIVVDSNGIATGLIDFARTASNGNIYYDFASVPKAYLDDFVCGYKTQRELDFDHRIVIATNLSCYTNYIQDLIDRGEDDDATVLSYDVKEMIEDFNFS